MKFAFVFTLTFASGLALGLSLVIWQLSIRRASLLAGRIDRTASVSTMAGESKSVGAMLRTRIDRAVAWLAGDNKNSAKQKQLVLFELPDFLGLLSAALANGDGIFTALARVAPRMNGELAKALNRLTRKIDLGVSLETALQELAIELPQPQLVELCNKLDLALRRGTPVADIIQSQSITVRSEIRNQLLKAAGRNETRMLIPLIFLILPVTVLFATYPSLQLLQLTM